MCHCIHKKIYGIIVYQILIWLPGFFCLTLTPKICTIYFEFFAIFESSAEHVNNEISGYVPTHYDPLY